VAVSKRQAKYRKLYDWTEDNIEETLTYYWLLLAHHKHIKSINMIVPVCTRHNCLHPCRECRKHPAEAAG
jgi:transposase-like protein